MAKACLGFLGQLHDAPWPVWVPEHRAQDCGRLRCENRPQSTGLSFRLVRYGPFNIDVTEGEVCITH